MKRLAVFVAAALPVSGPAHSAPAGAITYPVLCTVPGQPEAGMVGEIVVSASAVDRSGRGPEGE